MKRSFFGLGILPIKLEGWREKEEEEARKRPKTPKNLHEAAVLMRKIETAIDENIYGNVEWLAVGMRAMSEVNPKIEPYSKRVQKIIHDLENVREKIRGIESDMIDEFPEELPDEYPKGPAVTYI